ncbi:acetyl-CoA carboxylase carboxyltransferase subunit beta [Enterocloster clostridioformis]|uniref:acetyl-CoA carboxylase carboxyltransferase subunit beta n=1 Tax=Enterocloster clostridioformis TaxID=1531 RepID=UPI0026765AD7|nr:acetyl-CoA carboxylase carboxyltransferase subunit beta [Enterocloster clostridioformis]
MIEKETRLTAQQRVMEICDSKSFRKLNTIKELFNPIDFPEYKNKWVNAKISTGLDEAVLTGVCTIKENKCVLIILDSYFMMGTMGTVVGEEVTRAFEYAQKRRLPVVSFVASGGARMQEGLFSLYQMAKTAGAVMKHNKLRLLYVSVITHPTFGGVSASFASLGDIILIEKGASYGFTGKRVIEDTINQHLPIEFQSDVAAMKNGAVDLIISRDEMRNTIGLILTLHRNL